MYMPRMPEKIKKLIDVYSPYFKNSRFLPNAPQEAIDAWKEVSDWYEEFGNDQ